MNATQTHTVGEEPGRVEGPEDLKAVDEDEDGEPENGPVREPWLQPVPIRERPAVEAVVLKTLIYKQQRHVSPQEQPARQ